MDHSSTSSEISINGLPSKRKRPSIRKQIALSLSSQLIVLVFTDQPSAVRYFAIIFSAVFLCKLLENSSSASKYVPKGLRKFTKKHPRQSLMLIKLQAFTGATTECKIHGKRPVSETLF